MKMIKRKGMSLVELMICFAVIGTLALMVSGAVTSSYKTAAALHKIPTLYYQGRQAIEYDLADLNENITTKYFLEKDVLGTSHPDPQLVSQLNEVNTHLENDYIKKEYTIFGKTVNVYQTKQVITNQDGGTITLIAGTASGVRFERPVPIIDTCTAKVLGEGENPLVLNGVGKQINVTTTYLSTNYEDYYYGELYQWYVSVDGTHGLNYSDGTTGEYEPLSGTLMAAFPGSFTLISSEKTASITITNDYVGKFLLCLVTPLSKNGKMGEAVPSNMIYVSALPNLSYKAVIDPSLSVIDASRIVYDRDTGEPNPIYTDPIESTSASSGTFTLATLLSSAKINLMGETISSSSDIRSRYIDLNGTMYLQGSSNKPKKGEIVISVVNNKGSSLLDNLSTGKEIFNFSDSDYIVASDNETGWNIVKMKITQNGNDYYRITGNLKIAELIIVTDATDDGQSIIDYLKTKYEIN